MQVNQKKFLITYDEATLKPDAEGRFMQTLHQGLDSIDEILDLLAKDGKKYTYKSRTFRHGS